MPYAVPDISESLDRLAGYKLYSTFDLSAYFQQFDMEEPCRDLVAFLIPGDEYHPAQIWRYKRLTFGLVNASFWAQKQLAEGDRAIKRSNGRRVPERTHEEATGPQTRQREGEREPKQTSATEMSTEAPRAATGDYGATAARCHS
jgi:hypothetical protein